jgi:transketolase
MPKKSMRIEYGKHLVEAGKADKNIVVLDADLKDSTQSIQFEKAYPDRFFDFGVAEQNMVGAAAGFAISGKIPIVHSFATFISLRACEQVRTTIAYPNLNVKFVVSHGGISCGSAGTTHHSIEDIAILRSIPNMTVFVPCDSNEMKQAFNEALKINGPVYIRMTAGDVEDVYRPGDSFRTGKATVLRKGNDATIITTGTLAQEGLEAAAILKEKHGIDVRVLQMTSLKPIDIEEIKRAVEESRYLVTAEEHNIIGGLGSAVSEIVAELGNAKLKRIGIEDRFCGIGSACHLLDEEGLTGINIVEKVIDLIK